MAKLTLKIKKIAFKHPKTKQPGFVAQLFQSADFDIKIPPYKE